MRDIIRGSWPLVGARDPAITNPVSQVDNQAASAPSPAGHAWWRGRSHPHPTGRPDRLGSQICWWCHS